MRAKEFLLEYDRSREQQRIESLPEYPNRIQQDPSFSLEKLESADPTPQKTYVPRLATWWMRGAKLEDLISRGADNLEKFSQLKQKNLLKPEHKDINLFKQFADFEDVLSSYQLPAHPEEKQDRGKYKEIYRDSDLLVVQLLDETAAKFWGQKTRWCTSSKHNNQFDRYIKRGPLYVIIDRISDSKYQFWWAKRDPYRMQFMDSQDRSQNLYSLSFFNKLQKIFEPLHPHIMWKENPTKDEQLKAIKKNLDAIKFIKDPSTEVQKAVVQMEPWRIEDIKNPSEEVQLAAVSKAGYSLQYIKNQNPSEKVQLAAIRQDGIAIYHVKNPTEEMKLAAVQQDGYAIQYIKNPSEELQLIAVKKEWPAIQYIKNPSEEVQLAAIKQNKNAIKLVDNPTLRVQELAKSKKLPKS